MSSFLSYHLFQIGQVQVTVASLIASVVILAVGLLAARLVRNLIAERLLGRTHLAVGARYAVGRMAGYVVAFTAILLSLNALGIQATTIAAFGAALGVGIGFGLQDIVKNFVAGLIVLIERPIQVGDRIQVDKATGDVVEIRTRSTVIRTSDDIYLIVPNSRFITETVTNWSFRSNRIRFHVAVAVASDSDPRRVETALIEAATGSEGVLESPPPSVLFRGYGTYTLDFELLCWTSQMLHQRGAFESALHYRIHDSLSRHGIEVPNPQSDVRIRSLEAWPGIADPAARAGTEAAVPPAGGQP
jgi:small-conductance mechanosensitive channel